MINLRKYALMAGALGVFVIAVLIIFASVSKADGPGVPAPVTDPCFREDPECYDPPMVECDDNVFVPMGEGGTWDCPPPHGAEPDPDDPRLGQQLPEEKIGGARGECPDGSVGYVKDVEGGIDCPELTASQIPRFTPLEYGLGAVGLVLTAAGTLYMIYRKGATS